MSINLFPLLCRFYYSCWLVGRIRPRTDGNSFLLVIVVNWTVIAVSRYICRHLCLHFPYNPRYLVHDRLKAQHESICRTEVGMPLTQNISQLCFGICQHPSTPFSHPSFSSSSSSPLPQSLVPPAPVSQRHSLCRVTSQTRWQAPPVKPCFAVPCCIHVHVRALPYETGGGEGRVSPQALAKKSTLPLCPVPRARLLCLLALLAGSVVLGARSCRPPAPTR